MTFAQRIVTSKEPVDEDDIPGMPPAQSFIIALALIGFIVFMGYTITGSMGLSLTEPHPAPRSRIPHRPTLNLWHNIFERSLLALTDISHPPTSMLTDLYELTMARGLWESSKANEQVVLRRFTVTIRLVARTPLCAAPPSFPSSSGALRFTSEDISTWPRFRLPPAVRCLNRIPRLPAQPRARRRGAVPEASSFFREPMSALPVRRWSASCSRRRCSASSASDARRHQDGARGVGGGWPSRRRFGLRRARVPMAVWPSPAQAVAGCSSTSNVLAGRRYGIPVFGTHAHSWVMS